MIRHLPFIAILLPWYGIAFSQFEDDTCTGPVVRDTTYVLTVNSLLKPLHVHLMQGERCYTLIIYHDDESKPVQTIRHETESNFPLPTEDVPDDDNLITFVDVNFDHYKDLMVLDDRSIHNSFLFYIFDTLSGTFVYSEEFSDTVGTDPLINEEDQSIMVSGETSSADYAADTYEVHDGKLVLAESERVTRYEINGVIQKDHNGDIICIHELRRLVHGKMKLIKKVISPSSQIDEAWNKK
jgi:hypothetical protein